MMMMMMIEFL